MPADELLSLKSGFDAHESHMVLCNQMCLSVRPAGWSDGRFLSAGQPVRLPVHLMWQNLGNYAKNCLNIFFISALLIANRNFYHFMSLSVILTLAEGHKVSTKQKPVGFIFPHMFQLNAMKIDLVMKQFKPNILRLLLSGMFWVKGHICCFKKQHFKNKQTCRSIWIFINHFG